MRALPPALLIALLGCAGVSPDDSRVAHTRQSMLVFPDGGLRAKGTGLNAHLGAVIATCPTGGWIAGATGNDTLYVSSLRAQIRSGRPAIFAIDPLPILCLGGDDSQHYVMGGPNNTWTILPDGGSLSIYSQRADALAHAKGYLALSDTMTGNFRIFPSLLAASPLGTPSFVSPNVSGLGDSLAWSSQGDLLVGNVTARSAGVYLNDTTVDGGRVLAAAFFLPNPDAAMANQDFGRVVLIGDISSESGEEYIVAAPAIGHVYVFSGTDHVATFTGGPSFGAALAIEPADFGGLHALWVGEPAADTVHRYFGAQRQSFPAPPDGMNARFGASIGVDVRNTVAIGAPNYDDGLTLRAGAVFEATFDAGPTRGEMTQCVAGRTCPLSGCTTGVCISGVFCQQTLPLGADCQSNERCENDACVPVLDAGTPDAGAPDAGTPDAGVPDAGTPDAGTPDAGTPDAGAPDAGTPDAGTSDAGTDGGADGVDAGMQPVQIFHTCGCTTADLPLLLIALALFRRRVTATR